MSRAGAAARGEGQEKIECFCGKVAAKVIPWPEYSGVMAVRADGSPCCSALEGEYPAQDTAAGAEAVAAQVALSNRELGGRFYANRRRNRNRTLRQAGRVWAVAS